VAYGRYPSGINPGRGARVGIFDREGTAVVSNGVEFETTRPRSGWAEQDPGQWWSTLMRASEGALEKGGVAPEDIVEDEGDRPPLPQQYRVAWSQERGTPRRLRSRETPGLRISQKRAD